MGDFRPARPDIVRRLNAMAAGVGGARALVPLDPDELIERAVATTGLDDFGEPEWEEPYRRLVTTLDTEARLHVVGRMMCRHDLIRHLATRLTVLDAHRRDPGLADTPVPAPVFITGPARSGTSILQELLALDPNLRAPLGYEMSFPVVGPDVDDDERASWAECEYDLWGDVHPGFRAVHDLDARLPEECIWLLAPEFDLAYWATNSDVSSWLAYRAFTDPAPAYRMHKRFVQVLQAGTPSTWLFKSPVHLARLGALFETYPDARIIRTHRDPVKTAASTVSTLAHGRYTRSDEVDPMVIASTSVIGLQMSLNAIAAPEAALPAGQVAEIQYVELMRDPPAAIAGVYETLGLPMAPELPDLVSDYLDQRPKGRLGAHTYSVEDFGMDAGVIRKELAPYIEAFGVPSETSA
jgi:hypothetical protein